MTARLAWLVPVVTLVIVAVMLPLTWQTAEHDGAEFFFGTAFVAYAVVGALIASRHPRNPVGWLFAALGLLSALTETLWSYASQSAEEPGPVTDAVTAAAWVSAWAGEPTFVLLIPLLLLFPDGRFVSRGWRWVGTAAVVLLVVWVLAAAFAPGPLRDLDPPIDNPVGIGGLGSVLNGLDTAATVLYFLLVPVAVASVVVRYRSAGGEQRQQIKWLALAGLFAIAMIVANAVTWLFISTDEGIGDLLTALLVASAITGFPVAAGIAITRHGLYDIDVVISRALVYGSLTATLAGAYLGLVLVLQLVLNPVTGESDLAVAASTLAVAALFRPLRARIQGLVDRHFYRSRYDAARTLATFSGRLRDELDLDSLDTSLRAIVRDTVQPAHVSLWMRGQP